MSLHNATLRQKLEHAFAAGMTLPAHLEPHLAGALAATLRRPGGLIRATLACQVAGACGLADDRAIHLAIAMEYFHTASLVFDDLPAMDDASARRGEPCVHERFGEGAAILAALALINRAYSMVWSAVLGLEPARQTAALGYLETHLGVAGLLNGQSLDLHYDSFTASHSPQQIAAGKTVSLIRLPLVLPALLAGAESRHIRQLERIAIVWGLAYQSLDDLKDVLHVGDSHEKTPARDAHLDRPNLALAAGPDAAFARVRRLIHLADRAIARLVGHAPQFHFLTALRARFQSELDQLIALRANSESHSAGLALAS